jgi:hypothetical protein
VRAHLRRKKVSVLLLDALIKNDPAAALLVVREGGVRPLLGFVGASVKIESINATWTLYHLALNQAASIVQENGVRPLIEVLMRPTDSWDEEENRAVAWTLHRLAIAHAPIVVREGGVPALVRMLHQVPANVDTRRGVAWALCLLVEDYATAAMVVSEGGMDPLLTYLHEESTRSSAASALRKMAEKNPRIAAQIVRAGGALAWAR